ncbi:hypothetical protein DFH11DRAFT_1793750 [Phellopilus nigrolimitatus]|nr:hypothetical protein DFH11DRAFT_1793750 [Phellopilus nigrolimitatus]
MSMIEAYTSQNVVHHPTLCFVDGNIVLSVATAPPKQDARSSFPHTSSLEISKAHTVMLFRIHKSVLAANSAVFRDMLELTESPRGANQIYDGLPVVWMPDSVKEVEDLLKIFYRPWELPFQKHHPDTCVQLRNVLAMSTKYEFSDIRKHIVAHIEADWPSTLEDWDRFNAYVKRAPRGSEGASSMGSQPEPASALVLARRFAIARVLPVALYDLSRTRPSGDWDDECARADAESPDRNAKRRRMRLSSGTCASSGPECTPLPSTRLARWRLLSAEYLLIMLRGRDRLECFIKEESCLLETLRRSSATNGSASKARRSRSSRYVRQAVHSTPLTSSASVSTHLVYARNVHRSSRNV